MNSLAPIILFTYNRPVHTQRTIEHLQKNRFAGESDLTVFSDAPRNKQAEADVLATRTFLKTITGFRSLKIIEREKNFGLAANIIDGVTETVNKFGKVIVLEDDLDTSPYFLKYMNDTLTMYENEEKVISVHGYTQPVDEKLPETFFLINPGCWGWATWKRGWNLFNPDAKELLKQIKSKKLSYRFNLHNAYPFTDLLERQVWGDSSSWAIRWYASAFLNEKLTLYAGRSLVVQSGYETGIHYDGKPKWAEKETYSPTPINVGKIKITENETALRAIEEFYRATTPGMAHRLAVRWLRRMKIYNSVRNIKKKIFKNTPDKKA
ncbi:MAG: glycosyltransferase family 2 protein [Bacteroidales bacterium]|jgi:hypothetical protein|nr:glycosyltransferase family 2 protein [Bacteroidales bacterium]